MTMEEKLEALYDAVNTAWNDAYCGWEWMEDADISGRFILGDPDGCGFAFFLSASEELYSGLIWIEYFPEADYIGIYVKNKPIQPKFKKDFKALFEKHSPFDMKVVYEGESTPIILKEDTIQPDDFLKFFEEFKKAFEENYPLFYMFTVGAEQFYDGFSVDGSDC